MDATEIKMNKLDLGEDFTTLRRHKIITENDERTLPIDSKDSKEKYLEQKSIKNENNLEEVLSDFKLSGKYHVKLIILIALLSSIGMSFSINYIFSAESVNYRCKYLNCQNTELSWMDQNSTLDYKCQKYEFHNSTCNENNLDTSHLTDCTEWVYEKPGSLVAEFNLGCQDWKRTLVGTMHSTGFMLGLLLTGPLSDRFGRKKMIIFNTVVAGVIGIWRSQVSSYWLFVALEVLEPVIGENYSATFTMAIEMITTKQRPIVMFLLALSDAFGIGVLAVVGYLATNWRTYLVILYAPAFLFLTYIFWLDESLKWLLMKGRKAEAEEIIRQAAKMNNIVIDESKIVNLKREITSKTSFANSLKVTFTSRKLVIRLFLCICIWFTKLFNSYSLYVNSESLEGNKYINFGLLAVCEIVTGLILLFILPKFNRKGPLIVVLALTGALCVSQSFIPKGYRWLSITLYVCGKITTSLTSRMCYLYTTELFPTYTRNTMLALCSSLGRFGAILAPMTPLLRKYWSGLPIFLVGFLSLVTASLITLMPDTSEAALPDNVEQAEAVGIKQNKQNNLT